MSTKVLQGYDGLTEVLTDCGFVNFQEVCYNTDIIFVCQKSLRILGSCKPSVIATFDYSGMVCEISDKTTNFRITEGLGVFTSKARDSKGSVQPVFTLNKANKEPEPKYRAEFHLGRELIMPKTVKPMLCNSRVDKCMGRLIGMYIGDGFNLNGAIGFHFKKQRKIDYLESILQVLKNAGVVRYSFSRNNDKTCVFRVFKSNVTKNIVEVCGGSSKEKRIGSWDLSLYKYIFEGLKNSDGSVKRKTWSYSTSSESLRNDFLDLSPLAGISAKANLPQNGCHSLMVQTRTSSRINDTRRLDSGVDFVKVLNEKFYNLSVGGNAIITRRCGEILIGGSLVNCVRVTL